MKILIISYFFPPSSSVGGLRAYSLSKYLPEENIETVILTSGTKNQVKQNFQKNIDVDHIYYGKESKLRFWGYKTKILPILELLKLDNLLFFPDIYFGWIRSAVKEGLRVIEKEKPDVIYVTGPPYSTFIVGYELSLKTKLPLALEYRDPWTGNPYVSYPIKFLSNRARKKEKKIVAHSSIKVTVGPDYAKVIANSLEIKKGSFKIVHNGFFPEKLAQKKVKKNDSTFTISFFGNFYSLQKPIFNEVLEGVRLVAEKEGLNASQLRIQYAGGVSRSVLQRLVTKSDTTRFFEDLGFLSSEVLNEEIQKSNLVFLTVPNGTEYMLQTKIYDYFTGDSHILLVGEPGSMVGLCIEIEQKFTSIKSDRDAIAENLSKLYKKWKKNKLEYGCNKNKLENYNRRNLAKKLAKILKDEFKIKE